MMRRGWNETHGDAAVDSLLPTQAGESSLAGSLVDTRVGSRSNISRSRVLTEARASILSNL